MLKKDLLLLLIVALFACFYSFLTFKHYSSRVPTSPDEQQAIFFSKNLVEQKTLIYKNNLNLIFNEKIFASRQFVQRDGNSTPSAFLGYIILLALFRGADESLLYLSGPILAAMCLIFTYKVTQHITTSVNGFIAVAILAVFPPFIYWTVSYFNNLAELVFLLGLLYYTFKLIESNDLVYYLLTTLFFGLAIWIRYTNLLLLPFLILVQILLHKHLFDLKKIIISMLFFVVLIFPLFYANKVLYGSPFVIGQNSPQQLVYPIADDNLPKEIMKFVPFRSFNILYKNVNSYLFQFIPIIILLCLFGLIALIKKRDGKLISLATLSVLWIFYYLGGVYFGYGSLPILSSSYTRYLLVVYVILIIIATIGIHSSRSKFLQVLFLGAIFITSIDQTFHSRYGVNALDVQITSSWLWQKQLDKSLPKNAVIFVKGADKVIFPVRQTALYLMLSKNEKREGEGKEKTMQLISNVLDKGYPVYLLKEDEFYSGERASAYLNLAKKYNLVVNTFDNTLQLYEFKKYDDSTHNI